MRDGGDFSNTLELVHNDSANMGNFSIADILSNPDATIEKYKSEAMSMGIQIALIQAAAFGFIVYLILRNTKVRGK